MTNNNIWLIDHKATLSEFSPMNMDGSTWILGICVLNAGNEKDAMARFQSFVDKEDMELIEVYEIVPYKDKDFTDGSRRSEQVNFAAAKVNKAGEVCYVYARTSEAIDAMSEGAGDE